MNVQNEDINRNFSNNYLIKVRLVRGKEVLPKNLSSDLTANYWTGEYCSRKPCNEYLLGCYAANVVN